MIRGLLSCSDGIDGGLDGWVHALERRVVDDVSENVADLPDVPRDEQLDIAMTEVFAEVAEHAGCGHVDEWDRLGVEHDRADPAGEAASRIARPDRVGVGEIQAALHAQHGYPVGTLRIGVSIHVAVAPVADRLSSPSVAM